MNFGDCCFDMECFPIKNFESFGRFVKKKLCCQNMNRVYNLLF